MNRTRFCAIILLLFLTACAQSSVQGSPPEVPGLADYIEKCQRLNRDFENANIVYNASERMRRGDPQIFEAAATLRTELPPQEILHSKEATAVPVRVSCQVEAILSGAEFDIQPPDWQKRSLLTSPTARWTWSVTPKLGGNHELVLAVRPVVALEDELGKLPSTAFEASTETYRIKVDVSVPPDQWLAETFNRITSVVSSADKMLVAISALVGAISGFFVVRRVVRLIVRRWKRAKAP